MIFQKSNTDQHGTDHIHPDPKEECSLNVLNNSPGEEPISSFMKKLEMAKDIQLQTGKNAVCKYQRHRQ